MALVVCYFPVTLLCCLCCLRCLCCLCCLCCLPPPPPPPPGPRPPGSDTWPDTGPGPPEISHNIFISGNRIRGTVEYCIVSDPDPHRFDSPGSGSGSKGVYQNWGKIRIRNTDWIVDIVCYEIMTRLHIPVLNVTPAVSMWMFQKEGLG
jgi:hypothetical protein